MIAGIKIQVTPDLSERVQEIVFRNGGYWSDTAQKIYEADIQYLYIDENKELTYGNSKTNFTINKFKEVSAYDFIASQGEQEWLPKYGEEAEFSDEQNVWVKDRFIGYLPTFGFTFCCNKYNYEFCRLLKQTKTITIDGKDIEISLESFNAFKKQFVGE